MKTYRLEKKYRIDKKRFDCNDDEVRKQILKTVKIKTCIDMLNQMPIEIIDKIFGIETREHDFSIEMKSKIIVYHDVDFIDINDGSYEPI